MTVFELTKKLQQYPGDARVVMDGSNVGDYFADIDKVEWHRIEKESDVGLWYDATQAVPGEPGEIAEAVVLIWK